VNLNQVAREVVKLFDAQIHAPGRPAVEVKLELADNLADVPADPEQIRRALRNLVLNALDAMPAGGTLALRTEQLDGKVALEVSDSGAGLTPEECERLFTPYYTTKQQGTGLGLAIVQSVVSDHKGAITVRSEPGKGATFRIELRI
jgi:signal transduction histidine kinase